MDTNYLITQISKITGQLHGLFDEIGVSSHERESKEIEVLFFIFLLWLLSPPHFLRSLYIGSSLLLFQRHFIISYGLSLRTVLNHASPSLRKLI